MSNTVIKVEGLSKRYQLGTIGYGSLQHDLKAWWARVRGHEDPNAKIGEKSRLDLHGEFWALRDVGFEVQKGDRVGIIGRNGAGKSTLLKLLSRVTSPTTGNIKVRGRIASLLEVGTGFHPELTGRENVFLNGAILGMKRREIQDKFDEIVEFSGVEQFIDTPVKRYSSGMYVRLAFSVAAHLDSEILIVDEVLAVGDADFQEKCIGKMNEVSTHEGRTVLFVSHNIAAVQRLCGKGIYLREGRIQSAGTIGKTILDYTGIGERQQGARPLVWTNNVEGPMDSEVRVESFSICDDAGVPQSGHLLNSKVYTFVIEIDVRCESPSLSVFLSFYNDSKETVFVSDIQQTSESARAIRSVGKKRIQVTFPRNLFLTRAYSVEVSALLHFRGWPLPLGSGQRLEFDYVVDDMQSDLDYNDLNHPFNSGLQPGDLGPHLRWRVSER